MAHEIAGRRNSNDTAANGSVEVNASTFTAVGSPNLNRIFFYVANTSSTSELVLNLRSAGTAVAGTGICVPPGGSWEMPANNVYTGEISAITSAGVFDVMICEY